jgi:2-oxoglutarate dehydrogenase E1 component
MQVANCTTPAQYFHLLRRQMHRKFRSPLVLFTPKSLLRAPQATSSVHDFSDGRFEPVLRDPHVDVPEGVRRLILCSGKVYYDLEKHAEQHDLRGRVAIVRLEQLYPWPEAELAKTIAACRNADRVCWVQEEPANMGGWTFVMPRILSALEGQKRLAYAGRPASASPATGSMRQHRAEQKALVETAFEGL